MQIVELIHQFVLNDECTCLCQQNFGLFLRITRHHQPYNNCIQPNILLKFVQYIICLINLDFIYLH